MPGADKKWDAAAERDLCVAIIMGNQETDRARYNWAKVHSLMANYGYPFTKDAISQHFSKVIMKDFKARHNGPSAPSTPKKGATPNSKGTSSASAKKRHSKLADAYNADDDDVEMETPTKKVKRRSSEEIDDDNIKLEEARHCRERSATIAYNDEEFNKWINQDDSSS